jgi:GDPmannose 4,6-dehydratase
MTQKTALITGITGQDGSYLANISQGLESCLYMGNIDALRDWGHAKDYVRMQWMMLQQDKPDDFVIATGVQYSVRQFINWTAAALGMQLRWEGEGVNEVGYWLNPPAAIAGAKAAIADEKLVIAWSSL